MNSDFFDHLTIPESINEEKLDFLKRAIEGSRNLTQTDLIPYLARLIRQSKEEHLVFTDEEIRFMIMSIKASSSKEEAQMLDKLLNMSAKQQASVNHPTD